ncbi:SusC/RagA family TonB-linked outer membrane protein [Halalkalibaculum sp. DA3122]|uniref:SusC/RagA family TonB-linked outer membrane protein n=1 Tax=Halalkalibaculum sp. DA3122 TaxID=3373607 RepID=UPI003754911E
MLFVACISAGGAFAQDSQELLVDLNGKELTDFQDENAASGKLMKIVQLEEGQHMLREVLQDIARQAQLKLSYSEQVTSLTETVVVEESIQLTAKQAFWKVLDGTSLRFGISPTGQLFFFERMTEEKAPIQLETVSGQVTDAASGEPLPGVNVVVKGTTTGTSTDSEGSYELNVPSLQDTLVFSFIGYQTQEVPIDGRTSFDVALQTQAVSGEELVVTGYSQKRQSELSSSVSIVNSDQLESSPITEDLGTMLQGKVAGLSISNTQGEPGSGTEVLIRGVGSLGAGNSPLYVVDGIIGDGSDVNPSDIASISVLKDAAATGLYGSRAANGVIVIETKKGKRGETQVSYTGSFGISENRNFETMNSAELYAQYKMGHRNFYDDRVAEGDPQFMNMSFEEYLDGALPSSLLSRDTDWNSLLTRTGYVNQHQLSVSGGNEKTQFYVSGKYFNELGTLLGTEYREMNLRASLEHTISDLFTVNTRLNAGVNRRPLDPVGGQGSARNQYYNNMPWDPAYEEDGTPYNPLGPGNTWFGNASSNYFYNREHQSSEDKNGNLDLDLQLDVNLADWITFSTKNRVGFTGQDFFELVDKLHQDGNAAGGLVTQDYGYGNSFLTSNVFNFNQSFGEHNLSGVLGQEYSYSRSSWTRAVGSDIALGLTALSASGSPRTTAGGISNETGFLSYFGQVDYNYQSRYFLVGSLRYDASSRFGANNRWANFYSLGGSWLISNETFLKENQWIDILKLRASYGSTGNANIQPYLSLGTYEFSSNTTYNGSAGAQPARLPNPDLTWEKAYTTNVGVEFAFLDRFTIEVDLYNRDNEDLLQRVPLSSASGFASQVMNVGTVRNQGLDLSINTVNIQGVINWETSFSINFNRNEVLKLHDGADIGSGFYRISEGHPKNEFYMREWAGVDPENGDPLWIRWEDENGNKIDAGDHIEPSNILTTNSYNQASNLFVGSAYPDFSGGIQNQIFYKNFSFRIIGNYSIGQQIYFAHRMRIDSDGAHMAHNEMKRDDNWVRWEEPGDQATHPRMIAGGNKNSNQPSSRYLEDGSYFRIQNMNLGYALTDFLGLQRVQFNLGIDNMFVFTDFSGGDPDVGIEDGVINQGSNSRYSPTRKVNLGMKIDF